MKPFVIINPSAGSVANLDVLLKQLRRLGPAETHATRGTGEAEILARRAVRSGCDFIIAAGGDGTLNEIVNGIAPSRRARNVLLGLVPLGTGNDFARSLGLSERIDDAIDILRSGKSRPVDIVRARSNRVRYFINVSTGGFSGQVDEKLTPEIKRAWGPLAYIRSAAAALPQLQSYHAVITFDDREKSSEDVLNVVVANGRFVAGGLPIAPEANICDGLLDVILIPSRPPGEIALLAGQLLLGKHLNNETIVFRRATTVSIRSRPKMSFNVDGEPVGNAPIVFQVVPNALNFITAT